MAASDVDTRLDALMEYIDKSDDETILQIVRQNPDTLFKEKSYHCTCPECYQITITTPLKRLTYHASDHDPKRNHLSVIETLFQEELVCPNDFTDEQLFDVVQYNLGWKYNTHLQNLFLKWIPTERWKTVTMNYGDIENPEIYNILTAILNFYYNGVDNNLKLFDYFLSIGVDPKFGFQPPTGTMISCGMIDVLELVVNKYPDIRFDDQYHIDEFVEGLKNYAPNNPKVTKDGIEDMEAVAKIVFQRGIGPNSKGSTTKSVIQYIGELGWVDRLLQYL